MVPYILNFYMDDFIDLDKYDSYCHRYSLYGCSYIILHNMDIKSTLIEKIMQINYANKINTGISVKNSKEFLGNQILISYYGQISNIYYEIYSKNQIEDLNVLIKECKKYGIKINTILNIETIEKDNLLMIRKALTLSDIKFSFLYTKKENLERISENEVFIDEKNDIIGLLHSNGKITNVFNQLF